MTLWTVCPGAAVLCGHVNNGVSLSRSSGGVLSRSAFKRNSGTGTHRALRLPRLPFTASGRERMRELSTSTSPHVQEQVSATRVPHRSRKANRSRRSVCTRSRKGEDVGVRRRGDFRLIGHGKVNPLVSYRVRVYARVVENLAKRSKVDATGSSRQVLRRNPRLYLQVGDAFGIAAPEVGL
jgi:hypothetical protein